MRNTHIHSCKFVLSVALNIQLLMALINTNRTDTFKGKNTLCLCFDSCYS